MERNDEDDAWRAIVDNYGERPTLEDDPDLEEVEDRSGDARVIEPDGVAESGSADRSSSTPDPLDEGFVPPRPGPAPLPPADRLAAWCGLVGSPIVLVVLTAAGIGLPDWVLLTLVAAIIGGFGYLVATMGREPRNPWDDGAQV